MSYKAIIWEKMGENPGLQMKIALALEITQQAVRRNIERKSDTLTKYAAVKAIAEFMGVPADELFESEMEPA